MASMLLAVKHCHYEQKWWGDYWALFRTATILVSTGTPRATLTRSTASNGVSSLAFETPSARSKSATESCLHTYSTAASVPKVVVPARIMIERAGTTPGSSAITE